MRAASRETRGGAGITCRAGGYAIGRTRPRLSVALATTRPVLRASQQGLDGVDTFPRAVSLVAFVGPRSGDVLSPARGYHRVNGCRLRSDYCRPGRRLNSA